MSYRKNIKRKGFTLVELLIVIVVIGILSAMMMMSSREAVSSAKASNIIANLRNIKTATLAWYADNPDKITYEGEVTNPSGKKGWIQNVNENDALGIGKYLNTTNDITLNKNRGELKNGDYAILSVGGDDTHRSTWYVGYHLGNDDNRVKEKLKGNAKSLGLHFTSRYPQTESDGNIVWLKIMGDWSPSSN